MRKAFSSKKRPRSSPDPTSAFIRTAHSKGNVSTGIGIARRTANLADLPAIIDRLMQQPIYRKRLTHPEFPQSLSAFTMQNRFIADSVEKEIAWSAYVLGHFGSDLREFVTLRDSFEHTLLCGSPEQASTILDTIQARFGLSLWLLARRFQTIQLSRGLEAQKDFLSELLADDGGSVVVKLLSYYMSMRSEENVSFSSLARSAEQFISDEKIGDYARYHLLPAASYDISNPLTPIYYEQTQPIIDRFQVLISMTKLLVARGAPLGVEPVSAVIQRLAVTKDIFLTQLQSVNNNEVHPTWPGTLNQIDLYTEGRYDEIDDQSILNFELVAKGRLLNSVSTRPCGRNRRSVRLVDSQIS